MVILDNPYISYLEKRQPKILTLSQLLFKVTSRLRERKYANSHLLSGKGEVTVNPLQFTGVEKIFTGSNFVFTMTIFVNQISLLDS